MLAAAEAAGIVHAYGENMIHAPDFREIVDIIRSGTLGRPLWLRGREAHFGPHSPWFWQRDQAGGGALIDMGCHLIGLFNLIIGSLPEAVFAHTATLHHETDCEDNVLALLRYPGGTVGQCEASWTQRGGMAVVFEAQGAEGLLSYDRSALSQPIKVFARNRVERYFSEKAEHDRGWLFPTVDEYLRLAHRFEQRGLRARRGTAAAELCRGARGEPRHGRLLRLGGEQDLADAGSVSLRRCARAAFPCSAARPCAATCWRRRCC